MGALMPRPTRFFNQLSMPDVDRRMACCAAMLATMFSAFGINVDPETVEQELRGQFGEPGVEDGVSWEDMLWAVRMTLTGRDFEFYTIGARDLVSSLRFGLYLALLIHDDDFANPSVLGPNEHYIGAFGFDEETAEVECANPWGGRDIRYPLAQLYPATIEALAVRRRPQLRTIEDDDMQTAQFRHTNGTQHWAYINPTDRSLIHGAFAPGGTQPEYTQVGAGQAIAIHAFFQRIPADGVATASDPVTIIVDGLDGAEWFDRDLPDGADLTGDLTPEWIKR